VREYLAKLGFRSIAEAVGHAEMLDMAAAIEHWKADGLDLTPLLHVPERPFGGEAHATRTQDHGLDRALDNTLIQLCEGALESALPVWLEMPIRNVNRTVGTMLGHEVTKRYGGAGLPDGTISVHFTGSAGQSFGAFVPPGISLRLSGDANDYLGKGLSGGHITVLPPEGSTFAAEDNIIAGNVILYGATAGEVFLRGLVGERFCVRNSGATAVVEGVGDHGCEYMTGGRVLILGPTGRNFAAGMSGGIAYLLDADKGRINPEMVDVEALDLDDEHLVRDLLQRHVQETNSPIAKALLDGWEPSRFTKVMPRDYKRVLEVMREAQESGADADEMVMAAVKR
jgi:glutamate synthase (NADPH) large chain